MASPSSSPATQSPRDRPILTTPRNTAGSRNLSPYPSSNLRTQQTPRSSTTAPSASSATQTITATTPSRSPSPERLVLRLRGAHDATNTSSTTARRRRRITWAEDVIDNEGLGRKSSKVCCIYHKNREVGESSDDDDSSSSSGSGGSDTDSDETGAFDARPAGGSRHSHHHHGHGHRHSGKGSSKRKSSPNAYEKMPKYNVRPAEVKS